MLLAATHFSATKTDGLPCGLLLSLLKLLVFRPYFLPNSACLCPIVSPSLRLPHHAFTRFHLSRGSSNCVALWALFGTRIICLASISVQSLPPWLCLLDFETLSPISLPNLPVWFAHTRPTPHHQLRANPSCYSYATGAVRGLLLP